MKSFAEHLYPLGYLAQLCFSLRFLVQWISSEKKKLSYVPILFWKISMLGNFLLACHAAFQAQYSILLIQIFQLYISFRNYDLLKKNLFSSKILFWISCCYCALIPLLLFFPHFFYIPSPMKKDLELSFGIYFIGSVGLLLFAIRFWLQWLFAELHKKSHFPLLFWWMSLIGAFLSSIFFLYLHDPVNFCGTFFAMIPYARNLVLRKKQHFSQEYTETIFLIACEPSGDQLGKELIDQLKIEYPTTSFLGVGGEKMQQAGQKAFLSATEFEVMGFTELFGSLFRLYKNFHKIFEEIKKTAPKSVILIDYAEFNMLLAKKLRKHNYKGKIIHYVVPSVWAWRPKRIKTLVKTHDLLLSILPFEKKCFSHTNLKVAYVGHPLIKKIESHPFAPDFFEVFSLNKKRPILALFPGSRKQEIDLNFSYHLFAAADFLKKYPDAQIVLCYASEELKKKIEKISNASMIYVPQSYKYELMKYADFALATCGTIVLELAFMGTPTVVLYKIPFLNYLLGRFLFRIKLPFFSLPNIIQEKECFPEIINFTIDRKLILEKIEKIIVQKDQIRRECQQIKIAFKESYEEPLAVITKIFQT